ncbi:hypothetical protein HUU53_03900 [Candidatus Micrarchaeota archaeon]|nr:hypothetical protein [Candidatus Micrarchaeota archaeon]
MRRVFGLIVLVLLLTPVVLYADYAQTTVYFTVASSISFSVTMPDGNVTNSASAANGNPTTDIWFNSSTNTANYIEPCSPGGSSCQVGSSNTPIYTVDNTGTSNFTLWMKFGSALPSGVVVGMNSTVTSSQGQNTHAGLYGVNDTTWAEVVKNFTYVGTNTTSIYLWANFTSVAAGSTSRTLVLNSTQGALG